MLKVGGLSAFMRFIFIFMEMINEYLFKRKLRRDLYGREVARGNKLQDNESLLGPATDKRNKAIADDFSYEAFLSLKAKNRELSDKLTMMQEEIQGIKDHLKLY